MAIENFKPTIWRARVLSNLQNAHVFAQVANQDYTGNISEAGDTVKINAIGRVDVKDYSGSVSYEELQDASVKLTIDQEKYFAFKVDDVDAAQASGNMMDEAMEESSYALSEASDKYLGGLYSAAGLSVSDSGFDSDAHDTFAEMLQKLEEEGVPAEMPKWAVLSPATKADLLKSDIDIKTDNLEELRTGQIGQYMGFDIYVSNNLNSDTDNMAGTYRALGFAEQVLDTESMRLEDSFSDAVRGLYVYGGKVVRANELLHLDTS